MGLAGMAITRSFFRTCFAAGTPLLTPDGAKSIELFRAGDLVLSRDEHDPTGEVRPQMVEEVFERHSPVLTLVVAGQSIVTTGEHPFWAEHRGWTAASKLSAGERLLGPDGVWVPIDSVEVAETWAVVYNLRIAEDHTYFVGCQEWGFSVWAHNANPVDYVSELGKRVDGTKPVVVVGDGIFTFSRDVVDSLPQLTRRNFQASNLDAAITQEALKNIIPARAEHLQALYRRGIIPHLDIDATRLATNGVVPDNAGAIIFNGPYAKSAGVEGLTGKQLTALSAADNRVLIESFLESAMPKLAEGGHVFVTQSQGTLARFSKALGGFDVDAMAVARGYEVVVSKGVVDLPKQFTHYRVVNSIGASPSNFIVPEQRVALWVLRKPGG